MPHHYHDTTSAGEYLNVPPRTLKYWRWKGCGPKYRKLPNGKVEYRQEWLDEFDARHVVDPERDSAA